MADFLFLTFTSFLLNATANMLNTPEAWNHLNDINEHVDDVDVRNFITEVVLDDNIHNTSRFTRFQRGSEYNNLDAYVDLKIDHHGSYFVNDQYFHEASAEHVPNTIGLSGKQDEFDYYNFDAHVDQNPEFHTCFINGISAEQANYKRNDDYNNMYNYNERNTAENLSCKNVYLDNRGLVYQKAVSSAGYFLDVGQDLRESYNHEEQKKINIEVWKILLMECGNQPCNSWNCCDDLAMIWLENGIDAIFAMNPKSLQIKKVDIPFTDITDHLGVAELQCPGCGCIDFQISSIAQYTAMIKSKTLLRFDPSSPDVYFQVYNVVARFNLGFEVNIKSLREMHPNMQCISGKILKNAATLKFTNPRGVVHIYHSGKCCSHSAISEKDALDVCLQACGAISKIGHDINDITDFEIVNLFSKAHLNMRINLARLYDIFSKTFIHTRDSFGVQILYNNECQTSLIMRFKWLNSTLRVYPSGKIIVFSKSRQAAEEALAFAYPCLKMSKSRHSPN